MLFTRLIPFWKHVSLDQKCCAFRVVARDQVDGLMGGADTPRCVERSSDDYAFKRGESGRQGTVSDRLSATA